MKVGLRVALTLLFACAAVPAYFHLGNYDTSQQPNVLVVTRVDPSTLPGGVLKYYLSEDPPRVLVSGDSFNSIATTLGQSLALWNAVPHSALRIELAGSINTAMPRPQSFPAGILRFTDEVPPGALASGGFLSGPLNRAGSFFPITSPRVSFPADMSAVPSSGRSFLVGVTHEVGHSIGLHHSVPLSVMYQAVTPSRARVLWPDDEAGLTFLYAAPGFASSVGTISGRVISGGRPVALAGVTAMGTDGSTPVIGAYTAPDGTYSITGLPPGAYKVAVQPLPLGGAPSSSATTPGDPNDLISIRTLSGGAIVVNTDIDSQFFGGSFDPAASPDVVVVPGQTRSGVDFDVPARGPARLEALSFSATLPSGRGIAPVLLLPGSSMRVTASGIGLSTSMALSVLGPGVAVDSLSLRSASVTTRPHINSGLSFAVNTDASAPAGQRTLLMTEGADHYLAPGYLIAAAGQPPTVIGISPDRGDAGTRVTISGSSFSSSARVYFDGVPAQDVSVSDPNTIHATVPLYLPGTAARVFVYHADGFSSDMLGTPPVFQYTGGPAPELSVQPASARPGDSLTVTITGSNAHFAASQTTVGFGGGDVAVDSFQVDSPTQITARLRVVQNVRSTRYNLGAVTAGEYATLRHAFQVQTGTPANIAVAGGNNQTGPAGGALRSAAVVIVLDSANNPVEGAEVSFTFASGGGQASPPQAPTDQFGLAQATVTLGSQEGTQVMTGSVGGASTTFRFTAAGQAAPAIAAGGLVNAASFTSPVAPGAIVSLFGTNLAASVAGASSLPLPTALGNATVRFNGFAAPLFYVSSGQINAQVPYTVAGSLQVTVSIGALTSATFSAPLVAAAPGIFTVDQSGRGPGVVLHADATPVDAAHPAQRGEVLLVFASGLGPVQPPVTAGQAAPAEPLALVTQTTAATIGGASAPVQFAGLAPGFAGLYQVNVQVPAGVSSGEAALRISAGNQSSNAVTITVR